MANINWGSGVITIPKTDLDLVQSTPTEIWNLDLNTFRLNLNDLEDDMEGMSFVDTHIHNTEVTLSGLTYARVIEIVDPYTITFEDGQYAVNLVGANSNVGDRVNVNQVSVRSQNSAGLITTQAIEFGEFGEAVTLDVINGETGQVYPTGTRRKPSNNTTDTVGIAAFYGFSAISCLENTTFGTTNGIPDDIRGMQISGVTHVNTKITVEEACLCLKTAFSDCEITGILDGDSEITNCVVNGLTYFNGHIHNSYLKGEIILAGSLDANIENCSILDFSNPPIINAGGSGQDLMMPNYSGVLIIRNLTGNSNMGIGLDAGQIIIEDTCTSGVIQISGTGSVVDNSGPNCYVIDSIINGTDIQNLSKLIETQRPHHTGTGNIWFWNPYSGSDSWDGKHADRATKTFAQAQNLALDNNHDIIMCVAGDPSGNTITNENIVFTKNYLFLRGPGRDFRIHSIVDNLSAIAIQSNGVEVSSIIVTTSLTNTESAIHSSGIFPLIKDVYIEDSVNGIHITDGAFGIIENTRVSHGTGYGILIDGNSEHFTLDSTHIGSNTLDGLDINIGHEVTIQNGCIIHDNGGYGINISATTSNVQIGSSNSIFNNALGAINDLGTSTSDEKQTIADNTTSTIWNNDLSSYPENTAGSEVWHLKHTKHVLYIDTELLEVGDGSQHAPFNNLSTAVDFAEAHGIKELIIYSDITIDRQLKNFVIQGVGTPTVDCNNQNLTGSEFSHCTMRGGYTGNIIVQDSNLSYAFTLNGFFENCALGSTFIVLDTAYVKDCSALVTGLTPPSFDLSDGDLVMTGYNGGINIINCTRTAKIVMNVGKAIIDSSCTSGQINIGGIADVVNNTGGTVIVDATLNPYDIQNLHAASFNKRDNVANTITIYEEDEVTPRHVFDTNADLSVITPQ